MIEGVWAYFPGARRLGLSAALCLLWLPGCGGDSSDAAEPQTRPPTPVEIAVVHNQTLSRTLTVSGIVKPDSRIHLGFRIDGFVERFAVDEGDRVEAGAVIAQLDLSDLDRAVRTARVAVEHADVQEAEAKLAFDRQQDLHSSRSTSEQAYDRARLAWQAAGTGAANAALQLEAAEDRLTKGTLRAPSAGHIEKRLLEPHEPARAGEPVVILTALDRVTVRAAVADSAVGRLQIGGEAVVTSRAWPDREFGGAITQIDVSADAATRTRPFEVSIPNADLALRPEQVVDVRVPTGDATPTLTVPLASVLRDASGEPFCFVVIDAESHTRAARRPVQLGRVHGRQVTIARGLNPGEHLVVRGQHFLSDGAAVRVMAN